MGELYRYIYIYNGGDYNQTVITGSIVWSFGVYILIDIMIWFNDQVGIFLASPDPVFQNGALTNQVLRKTPISNHLPTTSHYFTTGP